MLNGLDLFSGVGGISIALSDWVCPIAFCEIDIYCQGVLLSRQSTGDLPIAPIWDDITSLTCRHLNVRPEIVYGGFPCQDISVAGLGKGLAGERSGLFFEIVRLCREIKPRFIFLENVPAITTRGGAEVVRTITEMGYDCRWCVISAASVGALHRRERWFLLAHSKHNGTSSCENGESIRKEHAQGIDKQEENGWKTERASSLSDDVADTMCEGLEGFRKGAFKNETQKPWFTGNSNEQFGSIDDWQKIVCGVCRTSDGVQFQVERLKCMGNSVVPIQAKEAFKILMGIK
jgi:DNA (cytosine-5)-methyltransferase 1